VTSSWYFIRQLRLNEFEDGRAPYYTSTTVFNRANCFTTTEGKALP